MFNRELGDNYDGVVRLGGLFGVCTIPDILLDYNDHQTPYSQMSSLSQTRSPFSILELRMAFATNFLIFFSRELLRLVSSRSVDMM